MVNTMFVLDRTLNTSHILSANKNSQSAFWEDTYTQEFDTGAESFEFSCYAHESIKEGNYVAFFYNNQYKMFQIIEVQEVHKKGRLVSECYCEIASLQLLNNYVKPFSGDMNCIQFFQHILHGTEWHIGKYSTSLENVVYTVNEKNIESVWSLIEDYKDIYGCEINVRVTYDNGHVTGQYIDIYAEGGLGSSTLKRFEYGRNVTGITKTKDLYNWCTGIILDVDCDVSNTVIQERDGYGFTKGAGDVILDDNANRMYNAGRTHVIGVYQGKETEPVEACINAWKELQKRKEPKFDYKVTTALKDEEYEDIHLGDTVYVVDHSYTPPLLLEARVGKLELSFTDRTQNSCTLTNYKEIKSKLLDADYIKLTGTITDVVNAFFPITSEGIADGAIVDGKIETTYFQEITADIVSAGIGAFEDLYVKNMTVINADIESLRADTAEITQLKSQLAEIDTLINGHLTSDNIQSLILTSDKVTVADAFIKDAMIDTISARKISTGVLNTNNVSIQSDDGSMLLQGNLQQFKDSSGKVRIQIGKDAQGDFTFCLFSQDGVGVLLDEDGIHAGAIGDGLIVNSMVDENANIQGSKLDINSVITSINNGTTTINSNRIYLDEEGQSLKVAFDQLKTKVETIEDVTIDGDLSSVIEQVTSNAVDIYIMQGEISSLISNTTITKQNGEVVQLKDEYNSTKNTVDSHTTKIGSLETNMNSVTSKQASMELDLNGFRTEVSNTYATKEELGEIGNFDGSGFVTKTEFTQTNEDFTFRIAQSGGGNLLKNSLFKDGTRHWSFYSWDGTYLTNQTSYIWEPNTGDWSHGSRRSFTAYNAYTHSGAPANSIISSEWCDVVPGDTYSYSFYCRQHRCWAYVEIKGLQYDGNSRTITAFEIEPYANGDKDDRTFASWKYTGNSFVIPSDIKAITLWIVITQHEPGATSLDSYFWLAEPCITRSAVPMHWVPHESELYDGIVKIDNTGLIVQQGNNKSVLDGEALNFYAGDVRYSRVRGGKFEFTNSDGSVIGDLGKSSWVDTNIGLSSVNARYGHSSALGAQYGSSEAYTAPLIVCSKDGKLTANGGHYFQGLNLSNPKVNGALIIRGSANDTIDFKLQGMMIYANYGDGYRTGQIFANEELHLGTQYGTENWDGLIIKENGSNNSKNELHAYGHLNMHNYNIGYAGWVNPVSATTTYTTRLLNEGSIENMTYGGNTFTEGELRYVHRETCHTVEEWDYNDEGVWSPLGVYYCYCELPIFMAENIELDYHVNIGKVGWGDYRVIEKNPYLFIVESQEEGFAFTWEVVAKQVEKAKNNIVVANEYVNTGRSQPLPTEDSDFTYELDKEEFIEVEGDNIQENINIGEE